MYSARAATLFTVVLFGFAGYLTAQTASDDLTRCADTNADASISACTTLIGSTGKPLPGQPENPDTLAKALTYRGFSYLKKNQYDRAIEDFTQAIRLDPANAWAFANRGNAYFNTHQPDRALLDYDEALRLNPTGYATLFYGRGSIYRGRGEPEHAIEQYDQAIQLQPEFPEAFRGRGSAYFDNAQFGRAIADFDQALRSRPDYSSALQNRGDAYAAKGQYDRAIEDYTKALELQPTAAALRSRGNAYRAKGDYDKALSDANAAIHSLASSAALANRATIYLDRAQLPLALQDFDEAVRIEPDDPDAFQSKGRAEFYLGQWNSAVTDLQKSLTLDASNPYTFIWLHLANARAGQDDSGTLEQQASQLHLNAWPGPIVDLLLGKLKPSYVIAFASDPDPDKTTSQRCEAEFYVGEYTLTQPDTSAATEHLQEARRICPAIVTEALAAKMELNRTTRPQ